MRGDLLAGGVNNVSAALSRWRKRWRKRRLRGVMRGFVDTFKRTS
jgi:hypothetical protein